MLARLGMFAGVLFAAPGCGPEPATPGTSATTVEVTGDTGASGTTSTAESDGPTTTADAAGGLTEPGGTTAQGDPCEAFLDETEPEPIQIWIRNDAQIPLILPSGPCSVSLFAIQSLADESSWTLGGCESTCEVPFCPSSCGSVGSIMIAPGGVFKVFQWDGMVLTPGVLPAGCQDNDEEMSCDVLRRARPGDYRLTVGFSPELLGCDPDPCTCELDGFDFCQIFNEGEPTPQFSAQVVFTMPTAGPIVISLSLP